MLDAVKAIKKTGKESFIFNSENLPINVLAFWQWSSSDLLGNALRGVLAEFIVASAIDRLDSLREEWDSYDLITTAGLKIEIKSSAYLQSWNQSEFSKISFGIQKTGISQSKVEEKTRKSDVYIFCILSHKDKSTVNPLNLEQWDFYILDTKILNRERRDQKTLSLSSLLKLNPTHVKYNELKNALK